MTEKLPKPTGTPDQIRIRRITSVGTMRPEQPAMNQPIQKTVPGKDSADTPT
jgi:hypothetical protein